MSEPRVVQPLVAPPDRTVAIPGSKSFTNRALVTAALAAGRSVLDGVLFSDDTEAMFGCLASLGIAHAVDRATCRVTVDGVDGVVPATSAVLDARQSGTTSRFVIPMVALGSGSYRVDGHPQLRARPMADLADALAQLGVRCESDEPGRLPLTVHAGVATPASGRSVVRIPGHVSSQFLSGVLLSAPYLPGGCRIELTSELVSKPYVEITLSVMRSFGVDVDNLAFDAFDVPAGRYRATEYLIEPDASAASYFLAAAAICGGRVRIEGLGHGAVQGDVAFADVLGRMGAEVERTDRWIEVRGTGVLRGIEVDMADISDTAQTLAAVAVFAEGPTRVTGIGFIRRKETDRVGAVVRELQRCGIDATEDDDGFTIRPGAPRPTVVNTYDDHRMAMSFALLGLRAPGIAIEDPDCVAKTFPDYFRVLDTLRERG